MALKSSSCTREYDAAAAAAAGSVPIAFVIESRNYSLCLAIADPTRPIPRRMREQSSPDNRISDSDTNSTIFITVRYM